jgi:hypothetical protein
MAESPKICAATVEEKVSGENHFSEKIEAKVHRREWG